MTVTDLIAAIRELERADLPTLMLAIAARMATEPQPNGTEPTPKVASDDDAMLTVNEAATRLRRAPRWIYRNKARLPFVRQMSARSLLVSKRALEDWLARQYLRP